MKDLIIREAAIEALEQIRYALWEIDIPSPTVPEYVEHHRDVQNVIKKIDVLRYKIEQIPPTEPEITRCRDCNFYDGRPCGIVDYYNTADDFCSRAERRENG